MSFMFPKEQDNPFIPEGPVQGEVPTSILLKSAFRLEGMRSSLGGAADRFAEEQRAGREESATLAPEEATKKYGIQGQLSFSSPIKESVAQVLNRRKQEELEYEKILSTADGFTQQAGIFTAAMASSLLDPLTLGASAIPVLGEARWAALIGKYGVVRGRVIGGMIEGGLGNVAVEPLLLYQAHRDQMNYTAIDSLINIGMGVAIGGGIGLGVGKWNQHIAAVQQKTHLNALKTAANQLASGKNVEVDPLIKASSQPQNLGKAINLDTGDYGIDASDVIPSDMITNEPPPFFINPTGPWGQSPGWISTEVYSSGVSTGDYVTIYNPDNNDFFHAMVVDTSDNGDFDYEFVYSSADPSVAGSHGTFFNMQNENLTVTVHTKDPTYVDPDYKPLVEDTSPLMGDGDQQEMDVLLQMKHEEALNWDNLTDSQAVSSDLYAGTHVGAFMRDVNTDKTYYTKYPNDTEQARQEYVAYLFYKLAGINVPEVKLIFQDGKLVGLGSKSLETDEWSIPQSKGELKTELEALEKVSPEDVQQFREGVIIDAWLGNRDFTAPGNVIIVLEGPEKGVYRIDYGGSLDYRAGGQKKLGEDPANYEGFGAKVVELDTFVDDDFPQASILGSNYSERITALQSGLDRLANISDDEILSVVYSVGLSQEDASRIASTLIARRNGILTRYGDFIGPAEKFNESFSKAHSKKFLDRASKFFQVISKEAMYHLDHYKGVGYGHLNEWLRGLSKTTNLTQIKQLEGAAKAMDEATRAYTFQATTYLWRAGVPLKAFNLPKDFDHFDTDALMKLIGGQTFHDKAFMSTSIDREFAMTWSDKNKFILRLQVPPGYTSAVPGAKYLQKAKDDPHYMIDTEFEFILPRNTVQVVTGAYLDPVSQKTVINVKVVPQNAKVTPMTSKQFIDVAKKYQHAPVIGADDEGLPEELVYSLKASMDLDDSEALVTQIEADTNEIMASLKQMVDLPEESFKQIDDSHAKMVEQANGMTKGAYAAFNCVMNNANV